MLALAAIVLVQFTAPVSTPASANLSETLCWASTTATGSRLCDRKQNVRYTEQFDRRYGVRVKALMQYHISKFGPDPDFIITTGCRILRGTIHRQDRDHARAMDRFEEALRDLEHQFDPLGTTQ